MRRRPRVNTGGFAHHALNRAVASQRLFRKVGDYPALESVLVEVPK